MSQAILATDYAIGRPATHLHTNCVLSPPLWTATCDPTRPRPPLGQPAACAAGAGGVARSSVRRGHRFIEPFLFPEEEGDKVLFFSPLVANHHPHIFFGRFQFFLGTFFEILKLVWRSFGQNYNECQKQNKFLSK